MSCISHSYWCPLIRGMMSSCGISRESLRHPGLHLNRPRCLSLQRAQGGTKPNCPSLGVWEGPVSALLTKGQVFLLHYAFSRGSQMFVVHTTRLVISLDIISVGTGFATGVTVPIKDYMPAVAQWQLPENMQTTLSGGLSYQLSYTDPTITMRFCRPGSASLLVPSRRNDVSQ